MCDSDKREMGAGLFVFDALFVLFAALLAAIYTVRKSSDCDQKS